MTRKTLPSVKIQVSFKENIRDIAIYDYLMNNIKSTQGISYYVKSLIEKDMKEKGLWKWD